MRLGKTALALFAAATAAGHVMAATGDVRIQVQTPAALQEGLQMPEAVRAECGVDKLIGNHVLQKVGERVAAKAWPADQPVPAGSALKLTIEHVEGWGGGGWSGRKNMRVRADVLTDGAVTASNVFFRSSTGGVFGGVMGTCAIMERIATVLGDDIAAWLPGATTVTALPKRVVTKPQGAVQQHRLQIPAATSFAGIDDVDAVPLGDKGRERYAHYLTLPSPKAIAISEKQGWNFYSNDADAMTKALEICTSKGRKCWLYAVDDRVVWSEEVDKRIDLSTLQAPH